MVTPNRIVTALIVITAILMTSSCKKETFTPKATTDSAISHAEAKALSERMLEIAFPGNGEAMSFKTETFACEVVTIDSSSFPYTKTYDYGTGCTSTNGEFRKGRLIVVCNSDDYLAPGTRQDISFSNYFNDMGGVTGSVIIENTGPNGNGNRVISYVANCQITKAAGGPVQLDIQQDYEWTAGYGTPQFSDDVFSITGSYEATAQNGDLSLTTVTQPLIRKRDPACKKFYVQGITLEQTTGSPDRYLDYGDGTCDDQAVETINGVSQTITLQ